jgi:hypothetical protein
MEELTDLEICKEVAETQDLMFDSGGKYARIEIWKDGKIFMYEDFNPLTDNSLCFKLMVKEKINLNHAIFTDDTLHRYEAVNTHTGKGFGFSKNPNKAICLAIIKKHNR